MKLKQRQTTIIDLLSHHPHPQNDPSLQSVGLLKHPLFPRLVITKKLLLISISNNNSKLKITTTPSLPSPFHQQFDNPQPFLFLLLRRALP